MHELLRGKAHGLFGAVEFLREAHSKMNAIEEAYSDLSLIESEDARNIVSETLEIKRRIWKLKQRIEQL